MLVDLSYQVIEEARLPDTPEGEANFFLVRTGRVRSEPDDQIMGFLPQVKVAAFDNDGEASLFIAWLDELKKQLPRKGRS